MLCFIRTVDAFWMTFWDWCINKRFPHSTINNAVINRSVMLTEQMLGVENSLLNRSLQIDSLVRQCGFLYVTDVKINLQDIWNHHYFHLLHRIITGPLFFQIYKRRVAASEICNLSSSDLEIIFFPQAQCMQRDGNAWNDICFWKHIKALNYPWISTSVHFHARLLGCRGLRFRFFFLLCITSSHCIYENGLYYKSKPYCKRIRCIMN